MCIYLFPSDQTYKKAGVPYCASSQLGRNANFAFKLMHLVKHQNKRLFLLRQKAIRIEDSTLGYSQAAFIISHQWAKAVH